MLALQTRVENGIRVLNERFSGTSWIEKINLEKLDMNRAGLCILGQIDGNYWTSPSKMGRDHEDNLNDGFISVGYHENKPLVEEWIRQINLIKNPPKEKEKAMLSIEIKPDNTVKVLEYKEMVDTPGIYSVVNEPNSFIYISPLKQAFYINKDMRLEYLAANCWAGTQFVPFKGEISINLRA